MAVEIDDAMKGKLYALAGDCCRAGTEASVPVQLVNDLRALARGANYMEVYYLIPAVLRELGLREHASYAGLKETWSELWQPTELDRRMMRLDAAVEELEAHHSNIVKIDHRFAATISNTRDRLDIWWDTIQVSDKRMAALQKEAVTTWPAEAAERLFSE